MLWLLGLLVVGQTGADYWWMGTKAFGGGNQPSNDLIEVQPGYSAGANGAGSNSRLIKDQQEREAASNPFLGTAQEPVKESICPEGQSCQASCPQKKKKIRGYGGIQARIVQVSVHIVLISSTGISGWCGYSELAYLPHPYCICCI